MRKIIYLLDVDDYAPKIKEITDPFIKHYAKKIGAKVCVINSRRYPDMPVTYEKLQIFDLAKKIKADWNIYIDYDTLIHPETLDFTQFISKDTVLHNGYDLANIRWKYDEYFMRDGRHIGSCNWFTMASDWCLDLWHPLDIPLEQAVKNIIPTVEEQRSGISPEHLIDDYTLSRNIARFGLKFKSALDIQREQGLNEANFFFHIYTVPVEEKVKELKKTIKAWNLK